MKKILSTLVFLVFVINCGSAEKKALMAENKTKVDAIIKSVQDSSNQFVTYQIKNEPNKSFLFIHPKERFTANIIESFNKECEDCRTEPIFRQFETGIYKTTWNLSDLLEDNFKNYYPDFKSFFKNEIKPVSTNRIEIIIKRKKDNYQNIDPFERESLKKEDDEFLNLYKKYAFVEIDFDLKNYSLETKKYTIPNSFIEDLNVFIEPEIVKEFRNISNNNLFKNPTMVFLLEIGSLKDFKYFTKNCKRINQFADDGCLEYEQVEKTKSLFKTTIVNCFLFIPNSKFNYHYSKYRFGGNLIGNYEIGALDLAVIERIIPLKFRPYSDYVNLIGKDYLFKNLEYFRTRYYLP
ncbi:hypothetical protein [Leptospira kanakyensis]|uniref:hypothetical protein n=1 Tax=Leptospira kanakyensis TaxID=2484968 RepID=UPI00223D6F82|nr:hypothetical protein [Leptospira kanakyensis]MCW7470561.1 hypothetical protein [Leptospira kanakyensis]